jgi:hypothetical protein
LTAELLAHLGPRLLRSHLGPGLLCSLGLQVLEQRILRSGCSHAAELLSRTAEEPADLAAKPKWLLASKSLALPAQQLLHSLLHNLPQKRMLRGRKLRQKRMLRERGQHRVLRDLCEHGVLGGY